MTEALIAILNRSIAASIIAVAVLLVRFPLKKAPKVFSYALWGVVFLRLVFSFELESPASLMPVNADIIPYDVAAGAEPQINSGFKALDESVNQLIHAVVPPPDPAASISPAQGVLAIGAYVWLFGVIVLLTYAIVGYIRLKRRVYDATLERGRIYRSDKIPSAFVLGLLRPIIYIPSAVGGMRLKHILAHERVHIRRRDYLIKPLAFLILTAHWFNPLIWVSYYLMSRDMELSCDEAVLRGSGEDIRRDYSATLVALYARKPALISPLAFGEDSQGQYSSGVWGGAPCKHCVRRMAGCDACLFLCYRVILAGKYIFGYNALWRYDNN